MTEPQRINRGKRNRMQHSNIKKKSGACGCPRGNIGNITSHTFTSISVSLGWHRKLLPRESSCWSGDRRWGSRWLLQLTCLYILLDGWNMWCWSVGRSCGRWNEIISGSGMGSPDEEGLHIRSTEPIALSSASWSRLCAKCHDLAAWAAYNQ
jgi:hypothetical protein